MLISSLEKVFKQHSGIAHFEFKDLNFINAMDPEDPEVDLLRKKLIDKAFEHPIWGEEMPTAWIPLKLKFA